MSITKIVSRYSPIGVCSMVAARIAEMEDVLISLQQLGMLVVTVCVGLIIHMLIMLPIIYFAVTRKNPYRFIIGMSDAMVTAFGIASR